MKKSFKKIAALLMVMMMTVALYVPITAAAADTKPTSGDTAKASVTNVVPGATVTAYKIVDANYDADGFTGYSWAAGTGYAADKALFSEGKFTLTSSDIAALAASKTGDLTGIVLSDYAASDPATTPATGTYSANLKAGAYIVVVTGSGTTVYNPMLLSVGYSTSGSGSSNTLQEGSVNAASNWSLNGETAYAKSSEPSITKTIVDSGENTKGDTVKVGDTVKFNISTQFPSYSNDYTAPEFEISDALTGLTLNHADGKIVVKVNGTAVTAGENTYSITATDAGMKITFVPAYVKSFAALAARDVEVSYEATVNSSAALNFDPNTNEATLTYSTTDGTKTKTDKTYNYTFGFDSLIKGTGSTVTKEYTKRGYTIKDGEEVDNGLLAGAEFTLYSDANCTTAVAAPYTTLADGAIVFTGLDQGTYYLKETKAPNGYQIDKTAHEIVIGNVVIDNAGKLVSYTVTYDGNTVGTYTNSTDTTGVVVNNNTANVKNTTLSSLPSTGGIGTYIFTIIGIVVMVVAAALLISRRKNSVQ